VIDWSAPAFERMTRGMLTHELAACETYFFREPDHFDFIRDKVLPDVRARCGDAHVVRSWSAGCATGEEAYSLAILLEETGVRGHVLATDISPQALRQAQDATYRPWALRSLDEGRRRRWFHPVGERWRLDARFKRHVTFERHNLVQDACPCLPMGLWEMDLILCRNVLIYFDRTAIARAARGLYETLAEGGWLLTGPSDPLLHDLAPLTPVVTEHGVFYRRGDDRRRVTVRPVEARELVRTGRAPDSDRKALAPVPACSCPPFARRELDAGRGVRRLAPAVADDGPAVAARHLGAVANTAGSAVAVRLARQALQRYRFSVDLHFMHAVLLYDLGRLAEAEAALIRVLYLDRSLVVASYLLGLVRRDRGDIAGARRAFRTARDLAHARPADELLPLADGASASALAAAADTELGRLDRQP
jgi:chemotaxis protein methyltransferase CheR